MSWLKLEVYSLWAVADFICPASETLFYIRYAVGQYRAVFVFVFVALRPKSTAMVIAGRSVHLTTHATRHTLRGPAISSRIKMLSDAFTQIVLSVFLYSETS